MIGLLNRSVVLFGVALTVVAMSATTADAGILDALKAVGQGAETALNGVVNGVKQTGKGVKNAIVPQRSREYRVQKQQRATEKSMAHAAKIQQRRAERSVSHQDGQKTFNRQAKDNDKLARKIVESYEREGGKQQRQADRQARANYKDFGTPIQRFESKGDNRRADRHVQQADRKNTRHARQDDRKSRRDDVKTNWNQNNFIDRRRGN